MVIAAETPRITLMKVLRTPDPYRPVAFAREVAVEHAVPRRGRYERRWFDAPPMCCAAALSTMLYLQ
jgi:hypothetical protein